jgi:hypothetical protein
MGTFTTAVEIGDLAGRRWQTVEVRVALEAFLLAVDTANRRLVPVPGLLKRFLSPTAGLAAG